MEIRQSSEYRTLREKLEVVIDFLSNNVNLECLAGKLFAVT